MTKPGTELIVTPGTPLENILRLFMKRL